MKKLRYLLSVLTVMISLFMCFDEGFSSHLNADATQIPWQSDCSGLSHHHHTATADHFFEKSSVSYPGFEPSAGIWLFLKNQSIADYYLSSIWQPPKTI